MRDARLPYGLGSNDVGTPCSSCVYTYRTGAWEISRGGILCERPCTVYTQPPDEALVAAAAELRTTQHWTMV